MPGRGQRGPAADGKRGGAVHGRPPALCHDMSCSPCRRRSSALPFLHIVLSLALRSAPFRPRRRRLGRPRGGGTLFLRAYPVRARPRPPARARRKAHVSRPFPPGLFRPPPLLRSRRKAKRRPRKPPSLHPHSTTLSPQSIPMRTQCEKFVMSCRKPVAGVGRLILPSAASGCGAGRSWAPAFAGVTKRGGKRSTAGLVGAPDTRRTEMCACSRLAFAGAGSRRAGPGPRGSGLA